MPATNEPHVAEQTADVADSGLECPDCDYNLTGLDSDRCPECGLTIDWATLRRERELEAQRPGTPWERSPWYFKPLAFGLTAVRVALLPWLFARELPARPSLSPAIGFLLVCVLGGVVVADIAGHAGTQDIVMWVIGVACQVLLQTLLFGLFLRPHRTRHPFRFWLAVSSYTSYPLLLEGLEGPPYILWEHSSVWPFSVWGGSADLLTNILYYLWWVGLAVVSAIRLPRRHRRRTILLVVAIPVLTYLSSYTGCYLGDHLV